MALSKTIILKMLAFVVALADANNFLSPLANTELAPSERVVDTSSLRADIEATLGVGIATSKIAALEDDLRPMYLALPKNQHGKLADVAVRYALHRVFVQRHGWSIKGLDPSNGEWNASSGILRDQVPTYILTLFEQRLAGHGLGLQELAVFASTLEQLIHKEATGRLRAALKVNKLDPSSLMSTEQADTVLDTYMMAYILGTNLTTMTMRRAQKLLISMPNVFLAWGDTQDFVRKARKEIVEADGNGSGLSLSTLVKIVDQVGEQFGKFQDAECKEFKDRLVSLEDRGSGRVRLADFYKPALDGSWQFQESIGYLRQLGVLDESVSDEPRVMLANYIGSQTNCIASSEYYSVCCLNECEDLFGHLESAIAAPEATPARVMELVSALPSSSISAPRTLSTTLRSRLEDIAAHHGGNIQLHGRLFAQWMHHAYPRECPFPHVSGTTKQLKAEEWADGTGLEATASEEELRQFVAIPNATTIVQAVEDVHDLMMWSAEEELLVVHTNPASTVAVTAFARAREMVLFATAASFAFAIVRTATFPSEASSVQDKFQI